MRGHHMFSLRNKKNYLRLILNTPSYLELCPRSSLVQVCTVCFNLSVPIICTWNFTELPYLFGYKTGVLSP